MLFKRKIDHTEIGSGSRRRLRWFVAAAICLFLVSGFLVALFANGPVRIPLLGSILAHQGSVGLVALKVNRASLDFTGKDGINLILEGLRADIEGPALIRLELPKLVAPLDRDSLFSGRINFSWLDLRSPHLHVSLTGAPAKVPEIEPLMETVDRLSEVVDDQFARLGLKSVKVRGGSLNLEGKYPRRLQTVDADIFRSENKRIRAYFKVQGEVTTWRMEMARSAPEGADRKHIGVVVNGITLAELLGPSANNIQGKGLGLPASAKIESQLDPDGKFISANAVARVENGWFKAGRTLVAFDDIALSLLFRQGRHDVAITRSHIIKGNTRIFFVGAITPDQSNDRLWHVKLDSQYPQFGSSDVPAAPVMLESVNVRAKYDFSERLFSVDRFSARTGKGTLHGVGTVQLTDDGPYLALAAAGEKIPVTVAKQLWPITLVPPARRWVNRQLTGGLIEDFSYQASIRPPAFNHRDPDPGWSGNDMQLDLTFSEASVLPIGEMPEITGLRGKMTVKDETLTIEAEAGTTVARTNGEVAVPKGSFKILNLPKRHDKKAIVNASIEGDALHIGSIVNSAPFKVLDKTGLEGAGVEGQGTFSLNATFPLGGKIDLADVDWRADGVLKNFTDPNPIMGHTIASADVALEADPSQVAIIGNGILDGFDADIDLVVPLGSSQIAARQDVVVSITAAQLKEKGIDFTSFIKGDLKLSVANADVGQDFLVDLKDAELSLDVLGWRKGRGVPAKAAFKLLSSSDGRQSVDDFELSSEGVDVRGNMKLSAKGELLRARFQKFRLRPGDNVEVNLQRSSGGVYDVTLEGASFDGRGLIRSLREPESTQGSGDFSSGTRVAVSVREVKGFNKQIITRVNGRFRTDKRGLVAANLSGLVNGRSSFEFVLSEQSGAQIANGRFEDTGATLLFLDLYERMRGGQGTLKVALADQDSWTGDFKVRSLVIAEDPAIQKIRQRETNGFNRDGTLREVQNTDGSASFDTLDVYFTREGDLMTIDRGALRGNVLGGTVSGQVDLASQTMDLSGTFVPMYALNNFFSKIPILGFALGGGSGEGLIGVTYKLSGAVADPVLTVNPISAIAPGIFRKMFEFQQN